MEIKAKLIRKYNHIHIFNLLKDITNKGFFHLLSANFIIGFIGFGSQLLVAKFLAPEELGQIKTLQAFIGIATIMAGFGFNTSVLKLCSEKRSMEERAFIFRKNLYYSSVPILFVLGFLFLFSKIQLLSPDRKVNEWMPFYMLITPSSVYISLFIVYLQALKKIQVMARAQVFIRLLSFIGIVYLTYLYGMGGYVFSAVVIGYISLIPLINLVKDSFKNKLNLHNVFKESFYYGKWSMAANAIGVIGRYVDIFMLNYLIKDRTGFGYYSLSTIFIFGMNEITSTAQAIATPYFSEKSNNRIEFLRVLKKYQKLMILLAFGITISAVIVVPPSINIIYGKDYATAGLYFRILTLKYFFWSCYALLGVAILGLGKMKYNFISSSISVPISLILSYFFITSHGLVGAAIAQALSYLLALIISLFMLKYVIKIHFDFAQEG